MPIPNDDSHLFIVPQWPQSSQGRHQKPNGNPPPQRENAIPTPPRGTPRPSTDRPRPVPTPPPNRPEGEARQSGVNQPRRRHRQGSPPPAPTPAASPSLRHHDEGRADKPIKDEAPPAVDASQAPPDEATKFPSRRKEREPLDPAVRVFVTDALIWSVAISALLYIAYSWRFADLWGWYVLASVIVGTLLGFCTGAILARGGLTIHFGPGERRNDGNG